MDICEKIKAARQCETCTASILKMQNASIGAAAAAFGLNQDHKIYSEIDSTQAAEILKAVLHKDMAYQCEAMSAMDASELANEFIQTFDTNNTAFYSNRDSNGSAGMTKFDLVAGESNIVFSWNPATESTFDAGVIALTSSKVGCVWIEDED